MLFLVKTVLSFLALSLVGPAAPAAPQAGGLPACVQVNAHARYGAYGYDHIVEIANRCERAATCSVTTNVNPDAMAVRVAAGELERVVTFRGSPAREFSATVRCELDD